MGSTNISAEQAPVEIANALREAAQDLRQIADDSLQLRDRFESENWRGLDKLTYAARKINAAYDVLLGVAEKFGLADEVAKAFQENWMVGNKRTVTEQGQN